MIYKRKSNGKGKVHPTTAHEGPEGEERHSSTLSLTSALDGVGGQHHAPAALPPGMRLGTHCTGGYITTSPKASQQFWCLNIPTVGLSPTHVHRVMMIYKSAFKQAHSRIFQDNEEPSNSIEQRRS
jgi:hypothetical protein